MALRLNTSEKSEIIDIRRFCFAFWDLPSSGLLRLETTESKKLGMPFCAVPVAFGFAHLTDEGGSTSSKVEGGIVSHGGRFKNKPQIEIAVRSELNLLERNA